jgi:DivIVA domain-containing protein
MSASLQERQERVERRLEALLLGLDETVRQVYESLLERGADYDELSPEKAVARLEGFHDYIITREETGVAHPTFTDYLKAKEKFGDEMLSFGSGKHSSHEPEPVVETSVEEEFVSAEEESVSPEESQDEEVTSFLADLSDLQASEVANDEEPEPAETPALVDEDESEEESIVEDEPSEESHEEALPVDEVPEEEEAPVEEKTSVWDDDDDEVVIIADEEAPVAPAVTVSDDTKAFEGFVAPVKEEKEEVKSEVKEKSVAGRINERVIIDKEFSSRLGGYSIDEVDDYLDELATFFKSSHSASEYTDKARAIEDKTFNKKNFKKGFTITEVDDFLDTVILELQNRAEEAK